MHLNSKMGLIAAMVLACGQAIADEPAKPDAAPQPANAPAAAPAPATPQRVREPLAPITWSDPEIEKIAKMLIGSWKSTAPLPEGADPKEAIEVAMFIAPARSPDLQDLMYVESARVDSLQAPYRQAFFQVYKHKGGLRLRTFEPMRQIGGSLVGLWANPDVFPPVSRRDLVATIDLDLTADGDSFKGKSPHPYPTGRLGAVEMTSEVAIKPDRIVTSDKGFDSNGEVIWGTKGDSTFEFARFEPPVRTFTREGNVFVIEYRRGEDSRSCELGDEISVHYLGFLSNGLRFDSSLDRQPPNPLTFNVNGKQVIPGFIQGLLGANVGTVRRVYIPWEAAYGEFGNSRTRIPPWADLYFDFEVMRLKDPTVKGVEPPLTVGGTDLRQLGDRVIKIGPDGQPIQEAKPKAAEPVQPSPEPQPK
ncbi:MAG: FKBP-type peptidyl-prolyl cis-trans isomerase [Phycisphaerae bacterium]|nr:FKBP-type peptidyl-prolyl cis-trans isomerase [Phycisphaerae bacterium]MBN8598852.1 FKBP-type peptidyl-prolyl cis-trans isomerase [Planctomycetota bacterium]